MISSSTTNSKGTSSNTEPSAVHSRTRRTGPSRCLGARPSRTRWSITAPPMRVRPSGRSQRLMAARAPVHRAVAASSGHCRRHPDGVNRLGVR